jgi:osmotically-inducible protein OsmY
MGPPDHIGHAISPSSLLAPARVVEGAENCLRHNSYLALKNVQCDFHEGVLTLKGCLPTYYLKQMAQSVVGRIEGVKRIVNEIEVVASAAR